MGIGGKVYIFLSFVDLIAPGSVANFLPTNRYCHARKHAALFPHFCLIHLRIDSQRSRLGMCAHNVLTGRQQTHGKGVGGITILAMERRKCV